jgi:hypothetical protein
MRTIQYITFLILILLFPQICPSQSNFWQQTAELIGGSDGITDILCTSDGTLFVTTSDSGINMSTDNGISWTLQSRQIARSICTDVGGNILIAKDSILISTDNGITWITGNNSSGGWWTLQRSRIGHIFACGNSIIRSTDNGLNWQSTSGFMGIGRTMAVDSIGILFVGSMSFGLSRSTDNGLNWTQTSLSLSDVYDIAVHPNNNSYATTNFGLLKSTDSGTNWNAVGYSGSFNAIVITGTGEMYVSGQHNLVSGVFKTTDEGITWSDVTSGLITKKDSVINKFVVGNDGYLFAVASSGKVFRSAEPVVGIPVSEESPLRYCLSQNYPNPFNPITQFDYAISKATDVTIKIYDMLGREISTLYNGWKPAGEYTIVWDAEGMPSGLYFYRIAASDYVGVKKMILVR